MAIVDDAVDDGEVARQECKMLCVGTRKDEYSIAGNPCHLIFLSYYRVLSNGETNLLVSMREREILTVHVHIHIHAHIYTIHTYIQPFLRLKIDKYLALKGCEVDEGGE